MKGVWVTALGKYEERVKKTLSMLRNYALDANGHFWEDDLEKMAWFGPKEQLLKQDTALWLILSNDSDLAAPTIRMGLSLLLLCVQAERGSGFPVVIIHEGGLPNTDSLPTPFQGAQVLSADNPSMGAKIVALANLPPKEVPMDYRLDVYAIQQIGLWFEVGPAKTPWNGVMFGVSGAEIKVHGVGPSGKLPEKAVLEYPMKGLKLNSGEKEYAAWAVKNRLDKASSYFLKVEGEPESILFGQLPEEDDADAFVLHLI